MSPLQNSRNIFALPDDYLICFKLESEYCFEVKSGSLYTYDSAPNLIYVDNALSLDGQINYFYSAFSSYLALKIAPRLMSEKWSAELKEIIYGEYLSYLGKAKEAQIRSTGIKYKLESNWLLQTGVAQIK